MGELSRRAFSVSANSAIANFSASTANCCAVGNCAFINFKIILSKSTDFSSDSLLLFTLPEGSRPSGTVTLYRAVECVHYSGAVTANDYVGLTISPDGRARADMAGRSAVGMISVPFGSFAIG